MSFFTDDTTSYVENLKALTKINQSILNLINNYSKVLGYEVNTQKSIFFYILSMNK